MDTFSVYFKGVLLSILILVIHIDVGECQMCKRTGDSCKEDTECCYRQCLGNTSKCGDARGACLSKDKSCKSAFDCCSGICSGVCADGCTIAGFKCYETDRLMCCSRNCYQGICQPGDNQKRCTVGGGLCRTGQDSQLCCSKLCYNGLCQPGENDCVFDGGHCRRKHDCCSGRCVKTICEKSSQASPLGSQGWFSVFYIIFFLAISRL